ncbi:MAG: NAD(P)-dependent oxidoreductase, partial [Alphaproteobacteria bacterium]
MTAFLFCCTGYPEAAWLAALRQHLPPEVEVRTMQAMGDPADIAYVAAWMPPDGLLASLPNLKVIFSIASGVGHILKDPSVPAHVPLVRMSDPMQWNLMAEFAVLGVLTFHRFLPFYLDNQKDGRWEVRWPLDTPTRPVGVLGLGGSGRAVAARLTDLGFTVHGWSRRKHEIAGITTWAGPDGLRAMLPRCAYVVCVLPLT